MNKQNKGLYKAILVVELLLVCLVLVGTTFFKTRIKPPVLEESKNQNEQLKQTDIPLSDETAEKLLSEFETEVVDELSSIKNELIYEEEQSYLEGEENLSRIEQLRQSKTEKERRDELQEIIAENRKDLNELSELMKKEDFDKIKSSEEAFLKKSQSFLDAPEKNAMMSQELYNRTQNELSDLKKQYETDLELSRKEDRSRSELQGKLSRLQEVFDTLQKLIKENAHYKRINASRKAAIEREVSALESIQKRSKLNKEDLSLYLNKVKDKLNDDGDLQDLSKQALELQRKSNKTKEKKESQIKNLKDLSNTFRTYASALQKLEKEKKSNEQKLYENSRKTSSAALKFLKELEQQKNALKDSLVTNDFKNNLKSMGKQNSEDLKSLMAKLGEWEKIKLGSVAEKSQKLEALIQEKLNLTKLKTSLKLDSSLRPTREVLNKQKNSILQNSEKEDVAIKESLRKEVTRELNSREVSQRRISLDHTIRDTTNHMRSEGEISRKLQSLATKMNAYQARELNNVESLKAKLESQLKALDVKEVDSELRAQVESLGENAEDLLSRKNSAQKIAGLLESLEVSKAHKEKKLVDQLAKNMQHMKQAEAVLSDLGVMAKSDKLQNQLRKSSAAQLEAKTMIEQLEVLGKLQENINHNKEISQVAQESEALSFSQRRANENRYLSELKKLQKNKSIKSLSDFKKYRQEMRSLMQKMQSDLSLKQDGETHQAKNIMAMMKQGHSKHLNEKDVDVDLTKGGKSMSKVKHRGANNLPVKKVLSQALPGRSISQQETRTGWIYLDTWYIIGPWENLGKVNWAKTHEVSHNFDLSKQYANGKNNKVLRWQFYQSPKINCRIPNYEFDSTYYAYTEVHLDKEQELSLAIGADDAAQLWVNGKLIYSREGMSDWHMDEALLKVLFKKGRNRVQVRIENGPGKVEFSVCLCPLD